jgi:hypothetical protein
MNLLSNRLHLKSAHSLLIGSIIGRIRGRYDQKSGNKKNRILSNDFRIYKYALRKRCSRAERFFKVKANIFVFKTD